MVEYNDPAEAGPRNHKWWLEPEDESPLAQPSSSKVPEPRPAHHPRSTDTEVMGFEEVVPSSDSMTSQGTNSTTDSDEEDDLVVTNELTRVNSFDFVAGQAQENETLAAMADRVDQTFTHEGTAIEPPVLALTNSRRSMQRHAASRVISHQAEEIEMVEQSQDPHVVDLEAARGEENRKKGGWRASLSLW